MHPSLAVGSLLSYGMSIIECTKQTVKCLVDPQADRVTERTTAKLKQDTTNWNCQHSYTCCILYNNTHNYSHAPSSSTVLWKWSDSSSNKVQLCVHPRPLLRTFVFLDLLFPPPTGIFWPKYYMNGTQSLQISCSIQRAKRFHYFLIHSIRTLI